MKITIKKKHLVSISALISISIGGYYFQELWKVISHKSISIIIAPIIFLITTFYVINYFIQLREQEKLINETSKEVSKGDPEKFELLKKHLWDKVQEEAYSLKLFNKTK